MTSTYSVLAFLAGIGIPIMAAMNSTLGAKIENTQAAAAFLCLVAFICCLTVFLFNQDKVKVQSLDIPFYFYLAGGLVAFYILTITASAKAIGLVNAIFLVLAGQIVAATLIDHFGAFGADVVKIDWSRMAGIAMMAGGVYLSRS